MSSRPEGGPVTIVGAGLCGSLLAIMLARRGFDVSIYERGADPRMALNTGSRSINLALAARGIRALERAGIFAAVEPLLVPMRGRMIHREDGTANLQPYGQRQDEQIFSVSRADLNRILIDAAEHTYDVTIHFGKAATRIDAERGILEVTDQRDRQSTRVPACPIIAADGAGSAMRRSLAATLDIGVTESLLPHGYKELAVPPGPKGDFQLEPDALHIWPRGGFMLIALPNPGHDFTLTMFLPNEGQQGFDGLDSAAKANGFFERYFADVMPLIPRLTETFLANPQGILGTVRCRRWQHGGKVLLIGDAAHAIVPFHGQGMNLAFEDCVVLDRILERESADWARVFEQFETQQRTNANAIADMALENYVEMRDTVRDPKYVLQKELAFELERRLPDRFIPRYSMVMFHDEIPYAVAQQRGAVQRALLEELTRDADRLEQVDIDAAIALASEELPPLKRGAPASRR